MGLTNLRLGVLDTQHPWWSATLAPEVEHLGFSRYWLGEHHGSASQSGSPEVLTGIIASITRHIRVGPAGILLRYYSPYKVVQSYRLLEELFHPRIDLGLARGLGGNAAVAEMLLDGRRATDDSYEAKVRELTGLLHGRLPEEHLPHEIKAFGRTTPPAELWVLGTTRRAALLAASVGASFAFSDYIAKMSDPDADGPAVVRAYREAFEPGPGLAEPRWNVAIAGAAVPDDAGAIATMPLAGPPPRIAPVDRWHRCLHSYAERYETDELIIFDVCEQFDDSRRSYALFAEAAGLAKRT